MGRIFAIADLHLGFGVEKTMDRYGGLWKNHPDKIRANTERIVGPEDALLLPGDLSWAKRRSQAQPDLEFIAAFPGRKICIKGNHDFWWDSDRPIAFPGLENPPVILEAGAIGIAGTRGWDAPRPESPNAERDAGLIERERERLRRSLAAIADCPTKIVMLHYPPHPFIADLQEAGVALVAYGHIHANSLPEDEILALKGEKLGGIPCYCVACDRIDMTPQLLKDASH